MVQVGGLPALLWLAAIGMVAASEATSLTNSVAPIELRLDRLGLDPSPDAAKRFGVWTGGGGTTQKITEPGLRNKQHMVAVGAGLDYRIADGLILGIGIVHEDLSVEFRNLPNQFDRQGWTIAPYVAWRPVSFLTLAATAGWGEFDNDTVSVIAGPGSYDTHRWHAAGSIAVNYPIGAWRLGASARYLRIEEKDDAFVLADGTAIAKDKRTIGQGRLTASLGYDLGGFAPFIVGGIEHEFDRLPVRFVGTRRFVADRNGFLIGGGFNFSLEPFRGTVRYLTETGRKDKGVISDNAKRLEFSLELPF